MEDVSIHCKYDKLVNPNKLKNHPKNRNKHPQAQIDRLAELYKYHGIRHPIIVSKKTGFVVAGHGRKLAAIRAGIKEYPVVYQDFTSDEAEYAFIQADNAIAFWAELDLAGINTDMADLGPDFNIEMLAIENFTLDMSDKDSDTSDEDHVPEIKKTPITIAGNIYELGRHRLMCGDSTSAEDFKLLMGEEIAEITFTSPPYNVGKTPTNNKQKEQKYLNDSDNKSTGEYLSFLEAFTRNCLMFSEYTFVNIQSLSGNKTALIDYLYALKESYADSIIWDKEHSPPAIEKNCMNSQFEFIHVFSKKANRKIGTKEFRGTVPNVYRQGSGKDKEFASQHKATFPVSFAEYFINTFCNNSVLDPFGGTGSTLIACEKTNRKCFTMELEPAYCDLIVDRWESYSGERALLVNV